MRGSTEQAVELHQRRNLAVVVRVEQTAIHAALPRAVALPLLVDREPLGQPPRHAVLAQRERQHVHVLVPHRRRPHEVLAPEQVVDGRYQGDEATEARSERAEPTEADRPHREVVPGVEDLDGHRFLGIMTVLLAQHLARLAVRWQQILDQHIVIVPVELEHGSRRFLTLRYCSASSFSAASALLRHGLT